jgi:hypothetical protein
MKKAFLFCIALIILVFQTNGFSIEKKNNLFGIEFGQNKILDKIHQNITGGNPINTITIKMFSTFNAKQYDSRKINSKILMKNKNLILLQSKVNFLDRPKLKGTLPFTYLCDGKNHWSDDNDDKKMVKLDLESKYYTELYFLENMINHRVVKLKTLKETSGEYQVTTEYQDQSQYRELITYHIAKPGQLINKIDFESWNSDQVHLEKHITYSKYIQIEGVYIPKALKVDRFRNSSWYETGEIEIEEIHFNQPVSQEVFRR